jgi:hypothetical protein
MLGDNSARQRMSPRRNRSLPRCRILLRQVDSERTRKPNSP